MIKTIIFTQAFKQNLTKFAPKPPEPVRVIVEGEESVGFESKETQKLPMYKKIDLDIKLPSARKVSLGDIEYTPIQRKFNVRPNKSEEVDKERNEILKKVERPLGILQQEQSDINHVKRQVDLLYDELRKNDLRASN